MEFDRKTSEMIEQFLMLSERQADLLERIANALEKTAQRVGTVETRHSVYPDIGRPIAHDDYNWNTETVPVPERGQFIQLRKDGIPENVYYNQFTGTFCNISGKDMGQEFFNQWIGRATKFTLWQAIKRTIPEGVYFVNGAFFDSVGRHMGIDFYTEWQPRAGEFPTDIKTPIAAMVEQHLDRLDTQLAALSNDLDCFRNASGRIR